MSKLRTGLLSTKSGGVNVCLVCRKGLTIGGIDDYGGINAFVRVSTRRNEITTEAGANQRGCDRQRRQPDSKRPCSVLSVG